MGSQDRNAADALFWKIPAGYDGGRGERWQNVRPGEGREHGQTERTVSGGSRRDHCDAE